jgi:hypothetical protein
MDFGNTYATPAGDRVMLYAEPQFTPPDELVLRQKGEPVTFKRIPPETLICGIADGAKGSCGNPDCHRLPLRECQCGRHMWTSRGFVSKGVFA